MQGNSDFSAHDQRVQREADAVEWGMPCALTIIHHDTVNNCMTYQDSSEMSLYFIPKAKASSASIQLEGKTALDTLEMGCLTTFKPLE